MADVLLAALGFALNVALPYFIVRADLVRLDARRLARAWPPVSFYAAVFAFGPLAVPVHFARTRRSLTGVALGLGLGLGALVATWLLVAGAGALCGVQ